MTSEKSDSWESAIEELGDLRRSDAAGPQELIVRTGTRVRRYPLRDGLSIGRAADRDVTLEGDYLVRPRHGVFKRADRGWEFVPPPQEECGQERASLTDAAAISVGSAVLQVGEATAASTTTTAPAPPSPKPFLPASAPSAAGEAFGTFVAVVKWAGGVAVTLICFALMGKVRSEFSRPTETAKQPTPAVPRPRRYMPPRVSPVPPPPAEPVAVDRFARSEPPPTPAETATEQAADPPVDPLREAVTVAADGTGDFTDVQAAIDACPEGGTVVVKPGHYEGAVTLERPVTLEGEGSRGGVVLETAFGNTLTLGGNATARNLTIRQRADPAGEAPLVFNAVLISSGTPTLERCTCSSRRAACVAVTGSGTNPVVLKVRAEDSTDAGLLVSAGAAGTYTYCDFNRDLSFGVVATGRGTAPELTQCVVAAVELNGVVVGEGAGGRYDGCIVRGAGSPAFVVDGAGTAPEVTGLLVEDGEDFALLIANGAGGTYENSRLRQNTGGILVQGAGTSPAVTDAEVSPTADAGLIVADGAMGQYERVLVTDAKLSGIVLSGAGTAPTLTDCLAVGGEDAGLLTKDGAGGTCSDCEFIDNRVGVSAEGEHTTTNFTDCRMIDNEQHGYAGFGVGPKVAVTGCVLSGNKLGAWAFEDGASPTRSGNIEE